MKRTRIILLCIFALMLVALLASCAESKPTDEDKQKREILRESLGEYTIITPLVGGDEYSGAVSLIRNTFSEKYGINVNMSDDFLMGDDKPSGKEIVLGEAKRDFVLDEFLPYDSYHIYFSGENIVINGGSPEAVEAAVTRFVSLFEEGGLVMNEEGYFKESEYPLGNLKINGKYINEYKIITRGTAYGTKYAANLLQKELRELTGFELKITVGNAETAFYIESANHEDGMYHVDVENSAITIGGAGLFGAYTATEALLEMIGESEDVTIESVSAPMLTLNNAKKKLEEGSLSVGYIGDSVMQAYGFKSYTVFLTEYLREAYPDADIQMKNHSIGGKNTTWGVYSIEKGLLSAGYDDLIFISLGTNDGPYGNDYSQMALNYQSMIEKIYANNPETEIVFITHGRKSEVREIMMGNQVNFITAMLDVASYYDIPVIDNIYTLANLWNGNDDVWDYYISDTVHPNTEGQKLYADTIWKTLSLALENSDSSKHGSIYMPNTPLFENSKANAVELPFESIKGEIAFGEGEEAGWGKDGTVTKTGASISYAFEGIGLELGIKQNLENAYFLRIQIFDEKGELVLEQERDAGYYYHLFVTNTLEYGKYTVRLTVTRPSERYPSDNPTLTLTDIKVIK